MPKPGLSLFPSCEAILAPWWLLAEGVRVNAVAALVPLHDARGHFLRETVPM